MSGLTVEEERDLRELFDTFDADHSGRIDSKELLAASRMSGMNPTRSEIDTAIAGVDVNMDGKLTYDEFKTLISSMKKTPEQEKAELEAAVQCMVDSMKLNDKKISKIDFMAFIQTKGEDPLTNEEVDELFRAVDRDGDAETLNIEEAVSLLTSMH